MRTPRQEIFLSHLLPTNRSRQVMWGVLLLLVFEWLAAIAAGTMAAPLPSAPASRRTDCLHSEPFQQMLRRHRLFEPEFARWRLLFAGYAGDLARLIVSFPGTEHLNESRLHAVFANPAETRDSLATIDVFGPWTARWFGIWSNGTPQYHIWDTTRQVDGRCIQPVSLSESTFTDFNSIEAGVQQGLVDIAVNIFDQRNGITGWVSKYQHGRQEIPHIGYLVEPSTLVWICQIKKPGALFEREKTWCIFFEYVDTTATPAAYRIYGQPFVISEELTVVAEDAGKHQGTYFAIEAGIAGSSGREHRKSKSE